MNSLIDIHTHGAGHGIRNCSPQQYKSDSQGWFSLGIHPWNINKYDGQLPWNLLYDASFKSNVLAIGESGLDKMCGVPMSVQMDVFIKHIHLAEKADKPLIIHMVKSLEELLLLRKQLKPHCPWIIHGFRGKPAQVQQIISHGLFLSYGEYYNPQSVALTPIEKMFIETDESSLPIEDILEHIASCKRMDVEELRLHFEENVCKVFPL